MGGNDVEVTHERVDLRSQQGRDASLPHNHPINALSAWRKFAILAVLSYSGFLANFSVAIIQVAFPALGATFGVSPGLIPNTIGYNLLGIAAGPILIWNPLSKACSRTLGRRPVYLLGSFLFVPCTIWMGLSPSYLSFALARVVAGLVSSFSQTVPPATIADIFVKEVRGSKMSMFGVAVVIAPAIAPLFCGLIVNASSWRNLFWFILGLACLQFALFFTIVPETLWNSEVDTTPTLTSESTLEDDKGIRQHIESAPPASSATTQTSGHVGSAWMPWQRPAEYMRIVLSPILMLRFLPITLTSLYYGSIFAWSVGITIVWPQKAEKPPYSFAEVPLGASFLAFGIGGLLGKWSGGIVGDKVVQYVHRKSGHRQPEHRLWALLPILPLMLVSCCAIGLAYQRNLHYMLILVMGGLFFFALSAATGILQTYVLETYLVKSMDAMAVFNLFKSMWGFAISFFVVEPWAAEHGYLAEYVTQGCLAAGVGGVLCSGLLWRGLQLRRAQGMPVETH